MLAHINMTKKESRGFTLIELIIVVAIIGVLTTIVLAFLSSQNAKATDKKVIGQLSSMRSQISLYSGTTGASVVPTLAVVSAVAGPTANSTIFNDSTSRDNSLYTLISQLPKSTRYYYAWDGYNPLATGKWFFAATLSDGAYCVDWNSTGKAITGAVPTTIGMFTDSAHFPRANAITYLCN
jgi:prepilin-type N-terminal cleavage/methylation domain-containing protein